MQLWGKLLALSLKETWLLTVATGLVLASELALRTSRPTTLLRLLERTRRTCRPRTVPEPEQLVRFVGIADRYAPGKSSCLRRAIALHCLFACHGIEAVFRIGVLREQDTVHAHAWLETPGGKAYGLTEQPVYVPLTSHR